MNGLLNAWIDTHGRLRIAPVVLDGAEEPRPTMVACPACRTMAPLCNDAGTIAADAVIDAYGQTPYHIDCPSCGAVWDLSDISRDCWNRLEARAERRYWRAGGEDPVWTRAEAKTAYAQMVAAGYEPHMVCCRYAVHSRDHIAEVVDQDLRPIRLC